MDTPTTNTSNSQLLSPPDFQEIFGTFNSDHSTPEHHQKPRKKRTKLIRINNSIGPSLSSSIAKPKYAKKPDPSAPKITRPCSECGKKFWSWKALFGHMRCHPERQWRGINPPPNFKPHNVNEYDEDIMTEEDHHVARCLLMLANGPTNTPTIATIGSDSDAFECASCKKVFGSRQALGGHRASHKNVKGCFAITRNDGEEEDDQVERNYGEGEEDDNKMMMVLGHKCGICLRVFSSGQALGGHKRCHWDQKGDEPSSSLSTQVVSPFGAKGACGLDLNLPAPQDYDSSSSHSSGLALDLRLGL